MTDKAILALSFFGDKHKAISDHETLLAVECVFEDDFQSDEVVFTVPADWLLENTRRDNPGWELRDLQEWLRSEYTSEDSEMILDSALFEGQVVTLSVF